MSALPQGCDVEATGTAAHDELGVHHRLHAE
jgi:hypothetical protein